MHKGIIMLLKANNKEDAVEKLNSFMEKYDQKVYDWWSIGGRYNGELSSFKKDFMKKLKSIIKVKNGFISQSELDKKQNELQKLWESLGAIGENPLCDHYNLSDNGGNYDIVPLLNCINIVKEWKQGLKDVSAEIKRGNEFLSRKNEQTGKKYSDWSMWRYCMKIAFRLLFQRFCSDCNIFNIEYKNYSIPKNHNGWYAIIIDIHY